LVVVVPDDATTYGSESGVFVDPDLLEDGEVYGVLVVGCLESEHARGDLQPG
jgi:hypothetical protein